MADLDIEVVAKALVASPVLADVIKSAVAGAVAEEVRKIGPVLEDMDARLHVLETLDRVGEPLYLDGDTLQPGGGS